MPICRVFERQLAWRAFSRACANTGKRMDARIAIIAITTRSSIRVKPRLDCGLRIADCGMGDGGGSIELELELESPQDAEFEFEFDGEMWDIRTSYLECNEALRPEGEQGLSLSSQPSMEASSQAWARRPQRSRTRCSRTPKIRRSVKRP